MTTRDKQSYLNASVILCGSVCLLRIIEQFVFQVQDWSKPMLIPGLISMAELCYPLLFAWIGMLIRGLCRDCKWWVQLVVATISLFCLFRYCTWTADHWFSFHLNITMVGLGFLIPPADLKLEGQRTDWFTLAMLVISVFCYSAIGVIKGRLDLGDVMPGFTDMEILLENLTRIVEPLLAILTAHFAIRVSFTSLAQKIGSNKWVRICAAAICVCSFLQALQFVLLTSFRWQYMSGYIYYYPLTFILAQPVTIYLVYVASRAIAEKGKAKDERMTVKELFKIF